ncbi:MAG: dethiobiotin synthase [Verrucomicrobiota bacterium]
MSRFFITGTDTGIGKTSYSVDLIRAWKAEGISGVGLKPFASGDRGDAVRLQEAMEGVLSLEEINPVILERPLAPWMAATLEGREIPYEQVLAHTRALAQQFSHVLVEGAGGWLVPLTEEKMIRDFARELGFPVIIVARAGVGTINQTLLTVESIQREGLVIEKIVLNRFSEETEFIAELNQQFLSKKTGMNVEITVLH